MGSLHSEEFAEDTDFDFSRELGEGEDVIEKQGGCGWTTTMKGS